jgi:hypothetical protein
MQQPSDRQPDLAMFSAILLEIYRLAREESLERFHHTVLECLRPQLAFDKAWWGRAAQAADGPHEHSSFLFGLPDHYIDDWKSIRQHDVTVARVHARPGQAVVVDMQADNAPPQLQWLGQRHDIGELLCVIHIDPVTQLSDHLALYRRPGAPRFTAADCLLLSCLMPHLASTVAINQIRTCKRCAKPSADHDWPWQCATSTAPCTVPNPVLSTCYSPSGRDGPAPPCPMACRHKAMMVPGSISRRAASATSTC